MDEGTKGMVRAFYVNGITLLLSAVGDPMILFVFVLYAMNVGAVLTILYFTFGDAVANGWDRLRDCWARVCTRTH